MIRMSIMALCAAATASAAAAQDPLGAGAHAGQGMQARHEAMQMQRAEDLKTILRLRQDQEPTLKAFLEAHKPVRIEHKAFGPSAPMTTPQRLEAMAEREDEMRAQHDRMRRALADFYAALSPDQQKVFDALQRLKRPGPGMDPHEAPGGPHRIVIRRGHPMEGPPPGS